MTESTLDREQPNAHVSGTTIGGAKIVLMILSLVLSVSMLKWAVVDQLNKYEPMGGSQVTLAMREQQLSCLSKNIYYEAGS